jgi:hypothetical protein
MISSFLLGMVRQAIAQLKSRTPVDSERGPNFPQFWNIFQRNHGIHEPACQSLLTIFVSCSLRKGVYRHRAIAERILPKNAEI